MSRKDFLKLQEIAAEKAVNKKAELLKELIKQEGVDFELVSGFLQKQQESHESEPWKQYCKKLYLWIEQERATKKKWVVQENKFFSILNSNLTKQEKLDKLNGLKRHISHDNTRIIEWAVDVSMKDDSEFFELACEIIEYMLSMDFYNESSIKRSLKNRNEKRWTAFDDYHKADFRNRIAWIFECKSNSLYKQHLINWAPNIVLTETNPFVIGCFLGVFPDVLMEQSDDVGKLMDTMHSFLDWPFTMIRVRVLQALEKVAVKANVKSRIFEIADQILSKERDENVKAQARYLKSLGDEIEHAKDVESEQPILLPQGFKVKITQEPAAQLKELLKQESNRSAFFWVAVLLLILISVYTGFRYYDAHSWSVNLKWFQQEMNQPKDFSKIYLALQKLVRKIPDFDANKDDPFALVYVEEVYTALDYINEWSYPQLLLLNQLMNAYPEAFLDSHRSLVYEQITQVEADLGQESANANLMEESTIENLQAESRVVHIDSQFYGKIEPSFSGVSQEFYRDGAKKCEVKIIKGIPSDKFSAWYENGARLAEETFFNGISSGESVLWYKSGQKAFSATYSNGLRDGELKRWYSNGREREKTQYKSGLKHGLSQEWDIAGNLIRNVRYVYGEEIAQ